MILRIVLAGFLWASGSFAGVMLACVMLGAVPVSGEDAPLSADARSTPVTRQEVWQAVIDEVRERGVPRSQWPQLENVDLPVALPALAGRKVRVLSACWDAGARRTQFRLECGAAGECLPFLAYVRETHVEGHVEAHDDDTHIVDAHVVDHAGRAVYAESCQSGAEPHIASGAIPKTPAPPAVRAGDRVIAEFVSQRLRITASVTCLDRGREGEVIRVRTEEGQIFRARISGPTLLEALPQ